MVLKVYNFTLHFVALSLYMCFVKAICLLSLNPLPTLVIDRPGLLLSFLALIRARWPSLCFISSACKNLVLKFVISGSLAWVATAAVVARSLLTSHSPSALVLGWILLSWYRILSPFFRCTLSPTCCSNPWELVGSEIISISPQMLAGQIPIRSSCIGYRFLTTR